MLHQYRDDTCHFEQREKSYGQGQTILCLPLTNWNNRVMYVGVTNNLERRLHEHKNKLIKGFTKKYNLNRLVSYEDTPKVTVAPAREKEIKKWRREKKNTLVVSFNPEWKDLSEQW